MFSKQEASQLRKEFWTAFGQYMKPVPSADEEKVNWVNYKTGEKNVVFRMDATGESASIAIEISHADLGIQQLYYEQFKELQNLLNEALGEQWVWELHKADPTGKIISRISKTLEGVSVYNRNDSPALISFFKPRIIALDKFWSEVRYGFEALG